MTALRRFSVGLVCFVVVVSTAGCCLVDPVDTGGPAERIPLETTNGIVGQNADGWKIYRSGNRYEILDPILNKWYPAERNYETDTVRMAPEVVEQWRKDRAVMPTDN